MTDKRDQPHAAAASDCGETPIPNDPPPGWEGPVAWLWIVSPLMVSFAAVVAVVAYLLLPSVSEAGSVAPADPATAVLIGLAVSLATWLISALLLRSFVSADRAQPRFYMELCERLDQLLKRLPGAGEPAQPAVAEACRQLDYAREQLRGKAKRACLRWALGHGYISVHRSIHRAEECLLIVESNDAVVGDAVHDDLLLTMSQIANRDELRRLLRVAIDPASGNLGSKYLVPIQSMPAMAPVMPTPSTPAIRRSPWRSRHASTASSVPTVPGGGAAGDLECEAARQTLRSVRHAINVFRDDARDGLIRIRGRLQWTTLALATLTFLLVGLAMIRGVPSAFVAAASAFYLVAAIVGGFNRLRLEATRSSAVDDFGLSQGRLFAAILISGLAGVGGVYLVAALPSLLPAAGAARPTATLESVFDLASNQIGLVFAAVFGLAPGLASKLLLQQADRLESDLLGSRPATGAPGAPVQSE